MNKGETKKSNRKIVVWMIVAAAVAAFFGWPRETSKDGPEPIVATIDKGRIENTVTAAGTMQPGLWVDVGAQVSGQLQNLAVDVGDVVKEGDVLAEIDASVQVNRVEASRASLQAQKAQRSARVAAVELALLKLERQKELVGRDLTSQTNLDDAINQLAAAESALAELDARVLSGTASLASDEAQLAYSRIFAPMAGTVVAIATIEGQTLNAVQQVPTILRIADLGTMIVRADVSEADVGLLKAGMSAYFTTLGGGERRWHGNVDQILPTPNVVNNVVFYPVLFSVTNEDRALLPEMTAQVFFVVESANNVLKVPVGALRYKDGRSDVATVRIFNEDGENPSREVELGITDRVYREVLAGLDEGEQVIAGIQESRRVSEQDID